MHSPMSRRELSTRSPSLLKDLQSGARPLQSNPGRTKTLTDVKLRILAVQRAVTVSYSSKEVAAQQLKAEEQQRIFRFIPNIYVAYEPHPEPLTTKMKFHLAYKGLTHPVFLRSRGLRGPASSRPMTPLSGAKVQKDMASGLGHGLADATTEGLFGNAILPSLLHQDPRYFYQGTGTKRSRARHAILAAFICKGDNGAWQPNYSTWGGSLISSSISTAYYPDSNRGARACIQKISGLAWPCMSPAVWPKSLFWTNLQAKVSTNRSWGRRNA